MAGINFKSLQKTATQLIGANGMKADLSRPGGINRVDGVEIIVPPLTATITGVLLDYKPKEIDGTRIIAGDSKFVATSNVVVKIGDSINILGKKYRVEAPNPLQPNGLLLMYELQLRG